MSPNRKSLAGDGRAADAPVRRSPKRREREIVATAAEIFRENGYADTSVQDVADAVGILKGSLYYYIDSKEDLLYRVLLEVHEDARGILEEIETMADASPLEKIRAYVRRHVEYNVRNMDKVAVYYHDFGLLSTDRKAEIRQQRRAYEDFLERLIEEAQKAGEVDPGADPRVLAYCMFGTMNWTYTWYRPNGRVSIPRLADMVAGFVGSALLAPPLNGDAPPTRAATPKVGVAPKRAATPKVGAAPKRAATPKRPAARKTKT